MHACFCNDNIFKDIRVKKKDDDIGWEWGRYVDPTTGLLVFTETCVLITFVRIQL